MNFLSCGWLWLYFGIFLMLLEIAAPGFVIIFFGLSALTVGVLRFIFGAGFDGIWQLSAFSAFSVLYLVYLRRCLKRLFSGSANASRVNFDQEAVGRTGTVTEAIAPSRPGRVLIGDAEWSAVSDAPLAVGTNVTVTAQKNLTMTVKAALCALLVAFAAGCNSYKVTQTSHFVNDDGMIVRIDYGRAEKDHVNTFVSPANGRELEFKSKLAVHVSLPKWSDSAAKTNDPPFDGESFTAWQCMNFTGSGTKYKTDDEEWYFLANGFTCRIAHRDSRFRTGYREVFVGVLCNTPVKQPEKDTRWYKLKPVPKIAN